jgi:hypothetical protein
VIRLLESFGWVIKFFLFIRVLYLMGLVAFWHNFLLCLTLQPTPPRVAPWGDRLWWPQNSIIANSLGSGPDSRMLVPKSSQICPSCNCWLRIWGFSSSKTPVAWDSKTVIGFSKTSVVQKSKTGLILVRHQLYETLRQS